MKTADHTGIILSTLETQTKIETLAKSNKSALILSAYFTKPAFEWLSKIEGLNVQLVVRASPQDVLSGSCDIEAIRRGLAIGWNVRFISSLHAKAYLIGDQIIIGSANLTSNGMALHDNGNLELNTVVPSTPQASELLNGIFDQSQEFDTNILDQMEAFVRDMPLERTSIGWWPDEVIPISLRLLYCNDLPICGGSTFCNEPWATVSKMITERRFDESNKALSSSHAYLWLKRKLLENGNELYFGKIASMLHKELADNPAPYRSDVKTLLANLLNLIQDVASQQMEVSRPSHSQRVRLLE